MTNYYNMTTLGKLDVLKTTLAVLHCTEGVKLIDSVIKDLKQYTEKIGGHS